jgi:hypothetical protein
MRARIRVWYRHSGQRIGKRDLETQHPARIPIRDSMLGASRRAAPETSNARHIVKAGASRRSLRVAQDVSGVVAGEVAVAQYEFLDLA